MCGIDAIQQLDTAKGQSGPTKDNRTSDFHHEGLSSRNSEVRKAMWKVVRGEENHWGKMRIKNLTLKLDSHTGSRTRKEI